MARSALPTFVWAYLGSPGRPAYNQLVEFDLEQEELEWDGKREYCPIVTMMTADGAVQKYRASTPYRRISDWDGCFQGLPPPERELLETPTRAAIISYLADPEMTLRQVLSTLIFFCWEQEEPATREVYSTLVSEQLEYLPDQ